jgi:lysyl-tRNA synthetase class I
MPTVKPVCPNCGKHQYVLAVQYYKNGDVKYECRYQRWVCLYGCRHVWIVPKSDQESQ